MYLKLNVCEIESQRYSTAHRVYKGTHPNWMNNNSLINTLIWPIYTLIDY